MNNADELEKLIIQKERQQMQMEEIRSILNFKLNHEPPIQILDVERDKIFQSPSDTTYLNYLRKPQKIQNNQIICISKGCLKMFQNGELINSYDLKNLTYVQQLKKNRLHLVFQAQNSIYIQLETQRKQLKFLEALNFALENRVFI